MKTIFRRKSESFKHLNLKDEGCLAMINCMYRIFVWTLNYDS